MLSLKGSVSHCAPRQQLRKPAPAYRAIGTPSNARARPTSALCFTSIYLMLSCAGRARPTCRTAKPDDVAAEPIATMSFTHLLTVLLDKQEYLTEGSKQVWANGRPRSGSKIRRVFMQLHAVSHKHGSHTCMHIVAPASWCGLHLPTDSTGCTCSCMKAGHASGQP